MENPPTEQPWNIFSGLLLIHHLHQILFVDLEEPPSFFQREIWSSAPLVEVDGGFVPLRHDEVHTTAARLYCRLTQFLQDFRANSKSSKILHDIEVFQVEQLPNPGVIGEIIHGKANDRMTWKKDAEQSLMFHLRSNKIFLSWKSQKRKSLHGDGHHWLVCNSLWFNFRKQLLLASQPFHTFQIHRFLGYVIQYYVNLHIHTSRAGNREFGHETK